MYELKTTLIIIIITLYIYIFHEYLLLLYIYLSIYYVNPRCVSIADSLRRKKIEKGERSWVQAIVTPSNRESSEWNIHPPPPLGDTVCHSMVPFYAIQNSPVRREHASTPTV